MLIEILGVDAKIKQTLQHIANLFFEDCKLSMKATNNSDISVCFQANRSQHIVLTAEINKPKMSKPCHVQYEKNSAFLPGTKEWDKDYRHVASHVFLSLLQQYTGMLQKWGILTGIRPIKLLHRKLQQGLSKEEAYTYLRSNYKIQEEKLTLMQSIVDNQLRALPDLFSLEKEVSIYIGIPFCPTKCAYCTFPAYAIQGRQHMVEGFLKGLRYEIRQVGKWLKAQHIPITTIYFGGGTPTSISAEEMDRLFAEIFRFFPAIDKVREITVEAGRPDTITVDKLQIMKKWNIDRISINPQSFIQATLQAIGRHHAVEETIEKFKLARQLGMTNINMDLIIGLPGEGLLEFQYTLDQVEKLMPESLTIHTLSFKRASEMTKNKQKYEVADRQEVQQMMKLSEEWTKHKGYAPYYLYRQKNILGNLENIGYCLPGNESLYNILIMEEQQTIIGLGCGAASKFVHPMTKKISRFANAKDPKIYNERYQYYTDKKIQILSELFTSTKDKDKKLFR